MKPMKLNFSDVSEDEDAGSTCSSMSGSFVVNQQPEDEEDYNEMDGEASNEEGSNEMDEEAANEVDEEAADQEEPLEEFSEPNEVPPNTEASSDPDDRRTPDVSGYLDEDEHDARRQAEAERGWRERYYLFERLWDLAQSEDDYDDDMDVFHVSHETYCELNIG